MTLLALLSSSLSLVAGVHLDDMESASAAWQTKGRSVSRATAEPSLAAVWHLDERSGRTAHDASGHMHDGSIRGYVRLGVSGKFKTAYRFFPASNIVVRDAPDLRPGTAPVAISYWLKLRLPPPCCDDYDLLVKGDSTSRGGQIKLEVQRNGQASCMFRGSLGEKKVQAGPKVIDGRWHRVVCKRVGDRIIESVDGRKHSVTKTTGAITVTAPVVLGSHERKGDWYEGFLDEVTYAVG